MSAQRPFLAAFLVSAICMTPGLNAGEPWDVQPSTLFAFDDHCIPWKMNLKLTLVPPDKHPDNPLVARGPKGSPDEKGVQFYGSVLRHDGKFKMWYIAMDDTAFGRSAPGLSGLLPAYAESDDGIHWHKPNLGLVEYRGSTQNNLVKMEPPGTCGIHLIVIHEPDDPDPSRQFKMLLNSQTHLAEIPRNVSNSVTFFSGDGLHWRPASRLRYENGRYNDEDHTMPRVHFEQGGLYRWNGMYYLPGQQLDPWAWQPDGKKVGRVQTTFRSHDAVHWEPESALAFVRGEAIGKVGKPNEDEEAHLGSSVWHRGNVLLGIYGLWHGGEQWKDRTIDLGLNLSNDGIHFREPIRDYVLIRRGETGEWDEGGLLQGQGFENVGDLTYIYYGSWDPTKAPAVPPRGGVGVVTLRRDGFGYLSLYKNDRPAQFVTSLLESSGPGTQLFVNADQLTDAAPISFELLDSKSHPIAGYSGADAATVTSSGLRTSVIWPKSKSASINFEGNFCVRVRIPEQSTTRIYALYLDQ